MNRQGQLQSNAMRCLRLLLAWVLLLVIGIANVHPVLAAAGEAVEVRVMGRLPMDLSNTERMDFERRTLALAKVTREEDAVTSYSCNADIESPGTYVFDEIWPSEQALRDHLATEHFKAWWAWVEPHLSGDLVIKVAPTKDFHTFS
jgi:quinol monooxygenase YgiN